MLRIAALLLTVVSIFVPLLVDAAEDPLRAFAERLGGSVFPAETDQPVTQLMLNNSAVSDEDLAAVAGRTGLQVLYLRGTEITDVGLAHLASLTGLYQLDLSGTMITDAGLAHLSGMANLAGLRLADTAVTDAGLPSLEGLTTLRSLDLRRTKVSAAGVESLRPFLPTGRIQSSAGSAVGDGVAAEIAAARAAARPTPKPTMNPDTPPCTDLSDVECLKAELSSGVAARCIDATNAIAEVRNERVQRGEVGADPELVEATAAFLFELAQKDGDRCQSSGFTGLDWLGPGIREVLPADKVVPFLIADIEAGIKAGRLRGQQNSALRILGSFGEDAASAVPLLSEIIADRSNPVTTSARPDALVSLAAIGPKARSAEPLLFAVMADREIANYRDVDARMKSAGALLNIGADPGRVAEALVPWLTEDDFNLRASARRQLIGIGEPAATVVAAGLTSSDPQTMSAAVDVLASMGPEAKAAIPEVVAVVISVGDPNGYLEMVLRAIGPGDDFVVTTLAEALASSDEAAQARAASILGGWGPAASAALPALRRLAESDSSASFDAKFAIGEIEGGEEN